MPVLRYITVIKSAIKAYAVSTGSSRGQIWLCTTLTSLILLFTLSTLDLRFAGIIIARFLFKMIFTIYYGCVSAGVHVPAWFEAITGLLTLFFLSPPFSS